jgi:aspartyl-tRNA(Asn)/glutamyl-tRNA(Gln) amidotransferase subunit C
MEVDADTVRRIARLARLRVTEAEVAALQGELSGWIRQLDEVDTSAIAPMTRGIPMTLKKRADRVTDGGMSEQILANAPACEDSMFTVPKVVE